ncbi:helix-turn-helix domain-containing protein [Phormidium nigroviride]
MTAHTALPSLNESLASYVLRVRQQLRLSQQEVSQIAGIHLQSLGKIERGLTKRVNQKTLKGLALALQVPFDYLDALSKGLPVATTTALKFCPSCWMPGTTPDPMWIHVRAQFCCLCGTQLISRCPSCDEPISSMKFRFCPFCGSSYKAQPHQGRSHLR